MEWKSHRIFLLSCWQQLVVNRLPKSPSNTSRGRSYARVVDNLVNDADEPLAERMQLGREPGGSGGRESGGGSGGLRTRSSERSSLTRSFAAASASASRSTGRLREAPPPPPPPAPPPLPSSSSSARSASLKAGSSRPGMRRVFFGNNQTIEVPSWTGRR